ncbi:MAG: adenylate/guanylate cyclase domain-containing protein [Candidatus Nitrosocosmicus sp.]
MKTMFLFMDINSKENEIYPYQSIIDLYESSLSSDVIASQLDINQLDVANTLENNHKNKQNKEKNIVEAYSKPKSEMINSVSSYDIENSIKNVQKRVWTRLKAKPIFNVNIKDTQKLLERVVNTDISLVILYVDVVNSTKISMNLPLKRLAPIIQTFTQEMSLIVDAYGGYVFKFLGDGILSFFFVADKDNLYLPCSKAIDCAHSMINVIERGINDILEENGYPELNIRVGIDVGENAVVQYNIKTNYNKINEGNKKENTLYKSQLDILGYTINTASKMTQYAKPNQIIIGSAVYNKIDKNKKNNFKKIHLANEVWDYIDNSNGDIYGLYSN